MYVIFLYFLKSIQANNLHEILKTRLTKKIMKEILKIFPHRIVISVQLIPHQK